MRRRGLGVGAVKKKQVEAERFKEKGSEISDNQFADMTRQLETFRSKLEDFAANHKQDIKKDAAFRKHFQDMCASIGVDPLASSKGFWSTVLDVGDFYYELGVQIVEVCMAASHRTGGLMELDELRQRVVRSRGKARNADEISADDVLRAIKKLGVLGNGFSVIPLNSGRVLVQSVPGELSMDCTAALQTCESGQGATSAARLGAELGWDKERARRTLDRLVQDGLAWVDEKAPAEDGRAKERLVWVPSIFSVG